MVAVLVPFCSRRASPSALSPGRGGLDSPRWRTAPARTAPLVAGRHHRRLADRARPSRWRRGVTVRSSDELVRPLLVCLLPARNAADQLSDTLDSIAQFADAIVTLDDGSTDETGSILRSHPRVRTVLTNRMRDHDIVRYDGANWNRLLAAAAEFNPQWLIALEGNERFDASDADALHQFVAHEALDGCAYGFKSYDIQAGETYDPVYTWAYRLFAFRPGQHFSDAARDVEHVPVDIPEHAWLKTTLRIKHYGEEMVGTFPEWRARPPQTPILEAQSRREAIVESASHERDAGSDGGRNRIVCLLTGRNVADQPPQWRDSVARFADAVVALDEGGPNRLLEAAGALEPDWVIVLEADELVSPGGRRCNPSLRRRTSRRGRRVRLSAPPDARRRALRRSRRPRLPPVRVRVGSVPPQRSPALHARPDVDPPKPLARDQHPDPAAPTRDRYVCPSSQDRGLAAPTGKRSRDSRGEVRQVGARRRRARSPPRLAGPQRCGDGRRGQPERDGRRPGRHRPAGRPPPLRGPRPREGR